MAKPTERDGQSRLKRIRVHCVQHCFVVRHEYLSERFRVGLILADFCLELRMMVNERLYQNCGSYFV